ncbi:MAG: GNAT family N-acetyltransferase [Rudaea sp.]
MTLFESAGTRTVRTRRLVRDDIDAVVEIDALTLGRSRNPYFVRRLAAALREPDYHLQIAAVEEDELVGYVLARVLEGEFGHDVRALAIEAIGVRHDVKGTGIGRRLLEALASDARRAGIAELRTQAAWNDHAMLRWLDENGFVLAHNHIVECAVGGGAYVPERDDAEWPAPADDAAPREIDYGAHEADDFARLARDAAEIRAMQSSDLPDVARVDRALTGNDRYAYMARKLGEALLDSAIRVSLTVHLDDALVGFAMARVDLGDFGRTDPVAVLDTIGVHPDYGHRRLGHALLSQLFANLGALGIERVESVVAPRDLRLLGFLYAVGFVPSQRIPFVRKA